jgi:hypothetical protein
MSESWDQNMCSEESGPTHVYGVKEAIVTPPATSGLAAGFGGEP